MKILEKKFSIGELYCKLLGFLVFILSVYFYPYYISGDQEHYREFYSTIRNYPVSEAYGIYFSSLGSLEPVYFLIVYYISPFIQKDYVFSVLNGFLFYFFSKILLQYKINKFIIFTFIFNFYLLVLFFAAERLKVALVLFLIAFMYGNKKRIYILAFSTLAHLQMTITLALYLAKDLSPEFTKIFKGKISFKLIGMSLFVLVLSLFLIPLSEQIYNKFIFYMSNSDGVFEILKPATFYILTLLYAKNEKLELTLMSLVIFVSVFFVGSDRLVMFSYFIFLYYSLKKNQGYDPLVMLVNLYFIYKSYFFILNILSCGEGFSCS